MNTENETELTDDVPGAGTNIRESNPALFGDDVPQASKLEDLTAEDLAAIAGDGDDNDPPAVGDAPPERDPATGKFIPKARFDEVNSERKAERDAREALEARLAALEKERTDAAEAARLAEEAKAKELHDFDADRDALQAKYDANEIDASELSREMRKLDKAERQQDLRVAEENAVVRMRKEQAAERERAENQTAAEIETAANTAAAAFLEKPENAPYKTDPIRIAALNVQREIIYAEKGGKIGWNELLDEAKARVEAYLGEKKAADKPVETEAERVKRERLAKQARATAEASSLPARPDGGVGARGTVEPEDENEISTEEWAKLPKAERDRRLGKDGSTKAA